MYNNPRETRSLGGGISMELRYTALMAGCVLALGCGTAEASLVKVEFQGTISLVNRQDGSTFGTVNVGDWYRAEYIYNFNNDRPFDAYGLTESAVSNQPISSSYSAHPVISYAMTINGKRVETIAPSDPNLVFYDQYSQAKPAESRVISDVQIRSNLGLYNAITGSDASISGNAFHEYTYHVSQGDRVEGFYTDFNNIFRLNPTSFSTSLDLSSSTVPLPASAPLLGAALLGLAGIGHAAKRRRAAAS